MVFNINIIKTSKQKAYKELDKARDKKKLIEVAVVV